MPIDDDLEIQCACGRVVLIIRKGYSDLYDPEKVTLLLIEACMLCCGCSLK